VDAAVAAGFAAALAEPGLTSLGGGGFLLLRQSTGEEHLLDFFVNAPGKGLPAADLVPHFTPITIVFSGTEQIFHAGYGSVAVPGVLDGYLSAQRRFGRLPLAEVLNPARTIAKNGVPLAPAQAKVVHLLHDILTLTDGARSVFAPEGRLPNVGDVLRNTAYAEFLDELSDSGATGWRDAPHTDELMSAMAINEGLLTPEDLASYAVVERTPLALTYRGVGVTTNPAPSFGGSIIGAALASLNEDDFAGDPSTGALHMVRAMRKATDQAKEDRRRGSSKGTTHISVVDGDGAFVSMTTSNGSCSGVMADGTGVQLNNVMGESDLHPDGFHATSPGTRIGSMMAPMLLDLPDGSVVALGSGGSERIRSALLQSVIRLSAGEVDLSRVIGAPRIHHDGTEIQVEPGLPTHTLGALAGEARVNVWSQPDLYFGGVHAVRRSPNGAVAACGDPRRDGVGLIVDL
jgi:gamma-glutamyltranspeptidase/glutathione hydrolase